MSLTDWNGWGHWFWCEDCNSNPKMAGHRVCAACNTPQECKPMPTITKSPSFATGAVIRVIDNNRLLKDTYYTQAKILAENCIKYSTEAIKKADEINTVAKFLRDGWQERVDWASEQYATQPIDPHEMVLGAMMQAGFNEVNWHEVAAHLLR